MRVVSKTFSQKENITIMKKLIYLAFLSLVLAAPAYAQNYIVDILYGDDSIACTPVIQKDKKTKNDKEARQKVYIHNDDAVNVTGLPADSLRLRDFMRNNEIEIDIDGKKYTTFARNIVLSDDNPKETIDEVNGLLKNKPCLFVLDIHGKHRYLFNYGIIVAMLAIGLFGAFLSIKKGRIGFVFLIVPLLYFTWFTLHFGWDSYWFIDPKADDSKYKIYLIFILAAAFAVFAVKAVWNLYDDIRGTEHRLGLIAAPFLLPILYITVWGGLMTQWFLLLVAFFGYGFILSVLDGSILGSGPVKTRSWEETQKEKEQREHQEYEKKVFEEQRKSIERWNKEHGGF